MDKRNRLGKAAAIVASGKPHPDTRAPPVNPENACFKVGAGRRGGKTYMTCTWDGVSMNDSWAMADQHKASKGHVVAVANRKALGLPHGAGAADPPPPPPPPPVDLEDAYETAVALLTSEGLDARAVLEACNMHDGRLLEALKVMPKAPGHTKVDELIFKAEIELDGALKDEFKDGDWTCVGADESPDGDAKGIVYIYSKRGVKYLVHVDWVDKKTSLTGDLVEKLALAVAANLGVALKRFVAFATDNAAYALVGARQFVAKCAADGASIEVVRCAMHGFGLAGEAIVASLLAGQTALNSVSTSVGGPARSKRRAVMVKCGVPEKSITQFALPTTRPVQAVKAAGLAVACYPSIMAAVRELAAPVNGEEGKQMAGARAAVCSLEAQVSVAAIAALGAGLPSLTKRVQGSDTADWTDVQSYASLKKGLSEFERDPAGKLERTLLVGGPREAFQTLRRTEHTAFGRVIKGVHDGASLALWQLTDKTDRTMELLKVQCMLDPHRAVDVPKTEWPATAPTYRGRVETPDGKSSMQDLPWVPGATDAAWTAWTEEVTSLRLQRDAAAATFAVRRAAEKRPRVKKRMKIEDEPSYPPTLKLTAFEYWGTHVGTAPAARALVPMKKAVLQLLTRQISNAAAEGAFSVLAALNTKSRKARLRHKRKGAEMKLRWNKALLAEVYTGKRARLPKAEKAAAWAAWKAVRKVEVADAKAKREARRGRAGGAAAAPMELEEGEVALSSSDDDSSDEEEVARGSAL